MQKGGNLKEQIYMEIPIGLEIEESKPKVCELGKIIFYIDLIWKLLFETRFLNLLASFYE